MPRLDQERQNRLEPKRIAKAVEELKKMGMGPKVDGKKVVFQFRGSTIQYFPYSGWATGKTIKDGRGLNNLLDQIKDGLLEELYLKQQKENPSLTDGIYFGTCDGY